MKEFKEITLKRSEIGRYIEMFTSQEILPHILDVPGRKFSYMIQRNIQFAEDIMKKQNKFQSMVVTKRGELSAEYGKKEQELLEKYSQKNDKGSSVVKNNMYSIPNDKLKEFNKKKDALLKEFPKDGKKQEELNEVMDKYMEEDITIKIYTILEEELPENVTARIRLLLEEYIIKK